MSGLAGLNCEAPRRRVPPPPAQSPAVTLRSLQEALAGIGQGPTQHQGVQAQLCRRQRCLDAHSLHGAGGDRLGEGAAAGPPPDIWRPILAFPGIYASHLAGGQVPTLCSNCSCQGLGCLLSGQTPTASPRLCFWLPGSPSPSVSLPRLLTKAHHPPCPFSDSHALLGHLPFL